MKLRALLFVLTSLFLSILLNSTHASSLPAGNNFNLDAELLGESRILVVMISQSDCSYCQLVHDDFLAPMHSGGRYQQKALFRELKIDTNSALLDFDGQQITPKQFAKKYQSTFTPTLLFLDNKGNPLVANMVGINTPEFYGYYLDQSIDEAITRLQHP
ncbi:thioredoxin family protein [Neptunomonas qingdaonensis]|uniref:Thioredoxin-related protein n=1 Tax=Neptunomonas qingdaonensis TaxID=1045558 RepID=A0A1I2P5N0_9GAMM|nr:thioredoxin fold domain-containing protein [Neptunomonas qingdaonensis]SFG11492.1 Thioredoxin-related protein [Neptunomonas qingdaonensis]